MDKVYAHFIGVGGAGMSGIAQVLHDAGVSVTGSDLKESRYARRLMDRGMTVRIGHSADGLGDPEVVVVSSAIPDRNPELAEAMRRGIPVWQRARMLAHLADERRTVAVAGTHGKTTTSSMAAKVLLDAGEDPTFVIGGELHDVGSNARSGSGEHYVVEADESDGSLLLLDPYVAVLTNVEADHLDHYGTLEAVEQTFREFLARVRPDGAAIVWGDDDRVTKVAEACPAKVVTYGATEGVDVRCTDLDPQGIGHSFSVTFPDGSQVRARVRVPGVHNVLNATASLAVAWVLGVDMDGAVAGLDAFSGVKRRFELVGKAAGVTVVDDYAHHPTEVKATLAAAKQAGFERVWVVFQPHRYSRTEAFGADFGAAFEDADRVVLMDVYSAGEAPIPGVSGKTVLSALLDTVPRSRAAYFPHRVDVEPYLVERVRPGDLVMTMGAGDVNALGPGIVRALQEREREDVA